MRMKVKRIAEQNNRYWISKRWSADNIAIRSCIVLHTAL